MDSSSRKYTTMFAVFLVALIYMNGQFTQAASVRIFVADHGDQYGDVLYGSDTRRDDQYIDVMYGQGPESARHTDSETGIGRQDKVPVSTTTKNSQTRKRTSKKPKSPAKIEDLATVESKIRKKTRKRRAIIEKIKASHAEKRDGTPQLIQQRELEHDAAGHNLLPIDDGKSGGIFDGVGVGFAGSTSAEEIERSVQERNENHQYSDEEVRAEIKLRQQLVTIERLEDLVETRSDTSILDDDESKAETLFGGTHKVASFDFVKEILLDGRGVFFSCAVVNRSHDGQSVLLCIHRRDALNIEVQRESDMQLFDPETLEPLSEHVTTFVHAEDPRIVVLRGGVYVVDNYQSDMVAHEIDVSGDIPKPTGTCVGKCMPPIAPVRTRFGHPLYLQFGATIIFVFGSTSCILACWLWKYVDTLWWRPRV
eukprot:m.312483 g.312483  ORF g.312483 m.312483 type:complete len:424 (+) comp20240_c0_seq1:135-1406(+)